VCGEGLEVKYARIWAKNNSIQAITSSFKGSQTNRSGDGA